MGPFVDSERRRPRAFWRLAIQFVAYTILLSVATGGFVTLWRVFAPSATVGAGGVSQATFFVLGTVGSLVGVFASVWLAGRFLDRRRFRDFGLRLDAAWWLDLGFGLALGAGIMTAIFVAQLSLGWVSVTETFDPGFPDTPFAVGILPPLFVFLCVGVYEELLSRGYQLRNLAEGIAFPALGGAKGAVVLSWVLTSSFFGFLHLGNPNATFISTVNIALAGILLGVGYVLTGQLAIPIGVHITWNFFQGSVYGFPVSGLDIPGGSFVRIDQSGPELWTGGVFGPEAGLFDPIAVAVGCLLTILWVRWRRGEVGIFVGIATPPEPAEKRRANSG